jgi:hypothetical protein
VKLFSQYRLQVALSRRRQKYHMRRDVEYESE